MKSKQASQAKKVAGKTKLQTTSVTLRVSDAHLTKLDELEKMDGVQRSAQIQRAIAEYLERRGK